MHALAGENGAGKSTMIKILGGRLRPDSGAVRIKGRPVELRSPEDVHALGARTVFQELTLFPGMTVAENLLCPARRMRPSERTGCPRPREALT